MAIIESYKSDFAKYGLREDLPRLGQLLDQTAQRVGQKIKFSRLLADEQSRTVRRLLRLLEQSRLLSPVFHSDANGLPLNAEAHRDIFKLLLVDVGFMSALLGLPWDRVSDASKIMSINTGALAEQFVGQELISTLNNGQQELQYWLREKKTGNAELDFVVAVHGDVVPVEVKAGKGGTLRSLIEFCEIKPVRLGLRFDVNLPSRMLMRRKNRETTGKNRPAHWELLSLPLYAAGQVERLFLSL